MRTWKDKTLPPPPPRIDSSNLPEIARITAVVVRVVNVAPTAVFVAFEIGGPSHKIGGSLQYISTIDTNVLLSESELAPVPYAWYESIFYSGGKRRAETQT